MLRVKFVCGQEFSIKFESGQREKLNFHLSLLYFERIMEFCDFFLNRRTNAIQFE